MDNITKEALSKFSYPAKYIEGAGYIFDAKDQMMGEVRAWGMLQYHDNPEDLQDALGRFMADAMNHEWEKYK